MDLFFILIGLALFWLLTRAIRWLVRRDMARKVGECDAAAERWLVRRDMARCEQRRAERDRDSLKSYRSHTMPGRRADVSQRTSTTDNGTSPAWDIPAMSAIHASSARADLEPTIVGGGGGFSGGGASGGWDSPSCSSSDSSSSSDSGSSCSSSD